MLNEKLDALPASPGVYLFKDKKGVVVYVGKAKSLRSRVRSYFQAGSSDDRAFLPLLRRAAHDLETVVAANEKEAAILEDALIKQHKPRYNVKLRDDKSFLLLTLDEKSDWPRLDFARGHDPRAPGVRHFGPFHSATAARRTHRLVGKHFQLRTCTDQELASRRRPCLQYQIRRCVAPCVRDVDRAWYGEQVRSVALFLEGRHDELSHELEERMRAASRALEFERAATYRDQLRAVEAIRQSQRVVGDNDADVDVVGVYRAGDLAEVAVLYVRGGKLRDTATFAMKGMELPDDELVAGFLEQHYAEGTAGAASIPDEVLVPVLPEGADGVSEWLAERRGKRCQVAVPQRGPRVRLLEMAVENAAHAFREQKRASDDVDERLGQLQKRLRLPTLPRRIECVDISHLGGRDTVGAIVALLDGAPDKKRYRTFRVKRATEGDDYGAMYEVLARRFRRALVARDAAPVGEAEAETARETIDWDLPDLLVVDGGRGQLAVALAAAHDLGLHDLPIVGLAKERNVPGVAGRPDLTDELREAAVAAYGKAPDDMVDRVYLPGQKNGIPLAPNSAALFFLAHARDEAHRFSNRGREKVGKTRRFKSALDDVKGVGPKARTALLRALGSLDGVRAASDETLLAVPGITRRTLAALRAHWPADPAPVAGERTATPRAEVTAVGASQPRADHPPPAAGVDNLDGASPSETPT